MVVHEGREDGMHVGARADQEEDDEEERLEIEERRLHVSWALAIEPRGPGPAERWHGMPAIRARRLTILPADGLSLARPLSESGGDASFGRDSCRSRAGKTSHVGFAGVVSGRGCRNASLVVLGPRWIGNGQLPQLTGLRKVRSWSPRIPHPKAS